MQFTNIKLSDKAYNKSPSTYLISFPELLNCHPPVSLPTCHAEAFVEGTGVTEMAVVHGFTLGRAPAVLRGLRGQKWGLEREPEED